LSALKSIELLLVEVGEPVVVDLLSITKECGAKLISNTVTYIASSSKKGPLASSQLSISKIGKKLGSSNKESGKRGTNNSNLNKDTNSTALSSKEVILSEKVSLRLINDLISSSGLL
jgi:hypothetical protein